MSINKKERELLDQVFADEALKDLREKVRTQCQAELAQRAKPAHRSKWLKVAAAAILLVLGSLFFLNRHQQPEPNLPATPDYIVSSRPMAAGILVRTQPNDDINVLPKTELALQVVTTTKPGRFQLIGDHELLANFPDAPCGIVGQGPLAAKLHFFNPDDEKKYLTMN